MPDRNQATTDDESNDEPEIGDRVLVRSRNQDALGKTGEIKEKRKKSVVPTYVVDLDGGGDGFFSSDVIVTVDDLDILERMRNVESVDEVIDALEQVKELLGGGDA